MADEMINADYDRAHRKAFLRSVLSHLTRQSNSLMPYREVRDRLTMDRETYRGMEAVPVDQIIGSVDRFRDFDRAFFPKQRHTAGRWKSIDRAYHGDVRLPPIQLYKVGDVYFVKDGNHRVSVAREHGVQFIDAEVIEGHVRVPLRSSMSPQQILHQLEYAEFLRRTNLDKSRAQHDIRPTHLGRFEEIIQHIDSHRETLSRHRGQEIALDDAAENWFDSLYLPTVTAAREQRLLRDFPDRTEADIYLWVMANRERIEREFGIDHSVTDPERLTRAYRSIEGRRNRIRRVALRGYRRLRPKSAKVFEVQQSD
ncbi:DUF4032 domain-containing protein [soil metagenome]